MEKYIFKCFNSEFKVTLKVRHIYATKRFAAQMIDENNYPVAIITVNIDKPLSIDKPNVNFVDINNLPNIEEFLVENKIAKPTGNFVISGFCVYPEYEFDLTKFEEEN